MGVFGRRNSSPYPFVVLEGPSGSGKSSAAGLVSVALGAVAARNPPDSLRPLRSVVDALDPSAQFLFYLAGNVVSSRVAEALLPSRPVVMDRYVCTTVTWYSAIGAAVDVDYQGLGLLEPDFTFLLTVSDEAERRRRVRASGREFTVGDADMEEHPDAYRSYVRELRRRFSVVEIDTATLSLDQVVDQIVSLVSEEWKSP